MGVVTRLRAYGGLWALVAVLSVALVFLAAAAGPVSREVADRALRQLVSEAPLAARDITVSQAAVVDPTSTAEGIRGEATGVLPPSLARVVGDAWGIQRTQILVPRAGASLTGEGIAVSGPGGFMPLATLHHQTGLADEVRVVEGEAPETPTGLGTGSRDPVISVMASVGVAEGLGLEVGQRYHLLLRYVARSPVPAAEVDVPSVALELTGVFEARDPAAAVWKPYPPLLRHDIVHWPVADDLVDLRRGRLVTDQAGIHALADLGLADQMAMVNGARIRLDPARMDAAWADEAESAVASVLVDPLLPASMTVETGLLELLGEYARQAAAARAVGAVVAAGVLGTGVGLLVLAARLTVERRRGELALVRARGGSLARLVGRVSAEAALFLIPVMGIGWLLHLPLPGRPDPGVLLGVVGAAPLAVAVVALLAVPVGVALALRGGRSGGRRVAARGRGGRRELRGYRSAPVRVTVEVGVVVLAGVGVLLLHQRGLVRAGTDPYLSAVPVLIGVAAGLLVLRLYPWPLRVLGRLAARGRGVVGFVGLARAGRVAPAAALPLLVLVLAVAVGGFAGGTYASVTAARDAAAVRAVGADARVEAEEFSDPARVAAAVAAVPGVESVAVASDVGFVRVDGQRLQNTRVFSVDAVAYQEVLAAIGAAARLPGPVVATGSGSGPVPILADPQTAGPASGVSVEVAGVEHPAEVVGGLADLPELAGDRDWVLVPRQALPEPGGAEQLLVAGPRADPQALRDAVAGAAGGDPQAVVVTRLAEYRDQLAGSGFNRGLTLVFLVGTAAAAAGGLLAIGMLLVAQATARGRALSLLRTMGLSGAQARGLLLLELLPVAGLAVAAGAVAGAAMPQLLAPALGLTEFTGGASLPLGLDLGTVGLVAGLLGVFLVGAAMTEAAINRRLGLGHVLRVD